MRKIIYISIICFILLSFLPIIYPLNHSNYEYNGFYQADSEHIYVTRREFYNALLRSIGGNDEIFEYAYYWQPCYVGVSYEDLMKSKEDSSLIILATTMSIVDYRHGFDFETLKFEKRFNADSYITVKEAAVIIQSLITENCREAFAIYGITFHNMYKEAKKSGIINKSDMIGYSFLDCFLTKENMNILFSRLMDSKRFRYIDGVMKYVDTNREMTYAEYILK